MKIAVLFFLLLFSLSGEAQIWVKNNATWVFSYHFRQYGIPFDPEEHFGYLKVQHTGDTLIQSHLCKKLGSKEYRFSGNPIDLGELVSITNKEDYYTYVHEDTVFYLTDGQFRVLYNFDLLAGDRVPVHYDAPETGECNDTSYVEIINAGMETIAGTEYRFFESAQETDLSWYTLTGRFTDRFGPLDTYLFPNYIGGCSLSGHQSYDYRFRCFRDDELSVDLTDNGDCPAYFLLSLEPISENLTVEVYPNPASDFISIKTHKDNLTYQLLDLSGQKVLETKDNLISLSGLETGIYFLKVLDNSGLTTTKNVIVQH